MKNETFRKAASVGGLLVAVVCLLALAVPTNAYLEEGVWVDSGNVDACPPEQVCAEWDVGGQALLACCIQPIFLGSPLIQACPSANLRQP